MMLNSTNPVQKNLYQINCEQYSTKIFLENPSELSGRKWDALKNMKLYSFQGVVFFRM